MAAVTVVPADLAPFADIDPVKAQAMIDDALALAAVTAPCILSSDFEHAAAAKAIIRGAILRWNDSGSGALSTVTTGPFGAGTDTRTPRTDASASSASFAMRDWGRPSSAVPDRNDTSAASRSPTHTPATPL